VPCQRAPLSAPCFLVKSEWSESDADSFRPGTNHLDGEPIQHLVGFLRNSALGFLETGASAAPRELPGRSGLSHMAARGRGDVAVHFARVTTNCTQALWVRFAARQSDLDASAYQRHKCHEGSHHEAVFISDSYMGDRHRIPQSWCIPR
jgi:hypothetical protein